MALSLLGSHKPLILQHESLESIVDFIKTMLPKLGLVQMEKTINQVRKTYGEDSIVSSFPVTGQADWNNKRKSCFSRLRSIPFKLGCNEAFSVLGTNGTFHVPFDSAEFMSRSI